MHESNTFAPGTTGINLFGVVRGAQISEAARKGNSSITGYLEVLDKHDIEDVPIFSAYATPGATVAADTFDQLWQMLVEDLGNAGSLDGLLIVPHGAGVSENHPDMDGWWLTELRRIVGPELPIIGVLDPHSNLTSAMLDATTALLPYKMNPHLDARERGIKAAELMVRTLNGEINIVQKFCAPPLIINIEKQHSESPPVSLIYDKCSEAEKIPGVLDACVLLGFQYADVPEWNSGILVTTDGSEELAEETAISLGKNLWDAREDFVPSLFTPEQAVADAKNSTGPVCLLDMGDNIGGGGSGEGTWLLHVLAKENDLKTFFCVYDPEAVQQATAAGVGARVELELGGKTIPERDGQPFHFSGEVKGTPPEQFHDPKMRHGGKTIFEPGQSVLLENERGNLSILVTSKRLSPNSPVMIPNAGLDPTSFDVIVAKGVNAPLGAFDEICPTFIKVGTRGVTSANLEHFTYLHRRQPLFPFERDFEFEYTVI
jgi:microcystin degradation protein MlrC